MIRSPQARSPFAAALDVFARDHADPVAGFFGPDSLTWRVNRETAVYLGGMRALLMQIAHPKVAQGVADHSNFRDNPLGRLRRTFDTVHAMVFGTRDEAVAAALRLHEVHARVRGRLADPINGMTAEYHANDPELLLWVFATLVDSSLLSYQTFVEPLRAPEETAFYEEARTFATLCGIDADELPPDIAAFRAYVRQVVRGGELVITPTAREIAETLLKGPPPLYPFQPSNYVLAAGMLPVELRERFGIGWTLPVRATYSIGVRVVRRLVPHMPDVLRQVPSSRRAARRCERSHTLAA
jgi:uncharacterized protein (DUF2236 family)